eukprot:681716-Alexandrium_andersonii.AAC.1
MSALRPCNKRSGRSGTTWSSRGAPLHPARPGPVSASAIPVTARAGPAGAGACPPSLRIPGQARPRPSAIPVAPGA